MSEDHVKTRLAAVLCATSAFAWFALAAGYQTCQSLAWLWQLVTGGAQ